MHEDMGNSTYQGYAAQAQAAATRLSAAEAFFEPELLAMEESRLQGFFKEDPKLEKYRLLIDPDMAEKGAHAVRCRGGDPCKDV